MNNPQYSVCDKDGMNYYAFCDANGDLICLVCTEYKVPWGNVLDMAYSALDSDAQIYSTKTEWNSAEWNTWFAFELCPAIEIINEGEARGIADEIRCSWDWRKIKP